MKKMAKRFFSSVIVLAMLMALLPASVANAATLVSRRFETEADISGFPTGLWGTVAYEWDNTVAYNGQASMKAVQSGGGYGLMGVSASYEYGKTYRISARVKFDNPQNVPKNLNFEIFGDKASTTVNWSILPDTYLRARSATQTVSDGEWHLFTEEFVFTNVNNGATAKASATVGIEANYGENDTLWIDDFSVVEVLSVDENKKGSFMAFKSFDGPSTEIPASNVVKTTAEAYEGAASIKVNNASSPAVQIGEYNLEVGQYYRVTSYVKTDYAEGDTSIGWISYDLRHTKDLAGVVTVKPKFSGFTENRPGYSNGFQGYEQYDGTVYNSQGTLKWPKVGNGWYRMGGAPVSAKDAGQWQRHERIFYVEGPADASVTSADMQLWIYMHDVPATANIYVDSVKLEKLGIDGSHKGMSQYGGTLSASGVPVGGVATGYKFVAGNNDNHSPSMLFNVEAGKKYRASTKVYIPSSNKAAVEQVIADAAADETAYSKNLTPGIKFGDTKVDLVYDQWVDVSFDYTADATKAFRFGLDGINMGYYYGNGAYKTVPETFYFQGFDFAEVTSAAAAAGIPDITFDSGKWASWGVTLPSDTTINDGEIAKQATYTVSYGVVHVIIPDLVVGNKYLAKAKFYLPKDQWKAGAQARFFLIDNQAVNGSSGYTQDANGYGMHKVVVDITEDMAGKWIDVQLPFTHAKAATDTDGIYWINAVVTGIGNTGTYYLADPKFVDVNKAGIENLEIQANGTVTYDANAVDYMLSYEYLDGTTVLTSGMIMSGEFLPKFDLADVKEPTVKLTASNAYGVAEETVVGTKAVEETPDIGGGEEGVFDVNSVTILDLEGDGVTGAQDISAISKGMYVDINYINSTAEAKQVWLMMAYYNADGLIEAKKYVVDLAVSADAKDEYYPAEPDDIPYVEGATVVKAFVWDIDGVEPLCEGYVVD